MPNNEGLALHCLSALADRAIEPSPSSGRAWAQPVPGERAAPWPAIAGTPCPRPSDLSVGGISKRSHRVRFAGHGAVRLAGSSQNDIWAERLVRTLLKEWAYAEPFTEPEARVASLTRFLDFYNRRRPHWSLAGQPPMSRVSVNNLDGKNS